jgi:hypothetical protein
MSRYETFVVRLWVEDDEVVAYGEVRHLTTSTGLRFRELDQAVRFINRMTSRGNHGAAGGSEEDSMVDEAHETRVFGFKTSPERGGDG